MAIKALVITDFRNTIAARPEAEVFLGLAEMGMEITLMTYPDTPYGKKFREKGLKVIEFHPEKKLDKDEIETIRKELVSGQYDILHLFNSAAIINGIQAAKGLPVKVILYRGYTGNIHWYDPTAYMKYLHPRVDKIICNSKGVEEYLHRQLFFDKSKTITINKGHDLEWYKEIKPLDLSEFNIPGDAFVVCCVANIRRMKGLSYLLKSTFYMPKEANIHFVLVGRDMDAGKYMKNARESPNFDKIHFPGYRNDSLHIVAASDVFALASITGESITKSVLEAMSLGVTPVITDIPGNRELVVDGENGFVVPVKNPRAMADAILKLYHDRELCRQMGENARRRIETRLSSRQTLLETKKLYEELTGKASES